MGATGCFSSKLADTTVSNEVTIGQGTTAETVDPSAEPHRRETTAAESTTGGETSTEETTGRDDDRETTTGGETGGDVAAGKTAFVATCGGCHALEDAGTSGAVGPNLDELAPLTAERVADGSRTAAAGCRRAWLEGDERRERRRVRGVGRRQVERGFPATPDVLRLPPGLDARAIRAVAMDLDGTVLDETFQPSARTAAAVDLAEASAASPA